MKVSVAVREPVALGVKLTLMEQFDPAATECRGFSELL
jgi:hypothetical protein